LTASGNASQESVDVHVHVNVNVNVNVNVHVLILGVHRRLLRDRTRPLRAASES